MLIVAANFYWGCVLLPGERRMTIFAFYLDFGRFCGAIVVKFGQAVASYCWFWLANTGRHETRAAPVTLAGLFMIVRPLGRGAVADGGACVRGFVVLPLLVRSLTRRGPGRDVRLGGRKLPLNPEP
jgi:hypothetical protein